MGRNNIRCVCAIAQVTALLVFSLGCERPAETTTRPDSIAVESPSSTAVEAPSAAPAQPAIDAGAPKLQPVDEANASFRAFRATALQALGRKDTTFLFAILAPEIKNSFGGDDSIAGFKRQWQTDKPGSQVWNALSRVLRMGGKQFSDSTFTAPYVYATWPDSIDAFEHVAVTGTNVRVHEQPAENSAVIGTTSYAILKATERRDAWTRVALPNARHGWIRNDDVYSPIDWRAFFLRRNGKWQLQTFVAGD